MDTEYVSGLVNDWRHPADCPPPRGKVVLLLTQYGVVTKGKWHDTDAAWMPLPKIPAELKARLRKDGRLK